MGSERTGHKLGQIVLHSPYLRLAVLTAAAATAAYVIGGAVALIDPVPAAITAVVATRATFHHAAKEALFQVIGVVAGSAVAFAAISLIGFGPATIAILVLASFGIIRLLQVADPRSAPYAAMAVAVTVILVIGAQTSPEGALERFLGVMVGGACALVASYFTSRGKPVGRAEVELSSIQNELAELLNDVAQGVQMTLTPDITRTWFDKAVRLRDETMRLAVAVEDVREHRRWSPAIHEFDLRELEEQLRVTQVMAARVLSIASDLNHLITERPAAGSHHLPGYSPPPLQPSPTRQLTVLLAKQAFIKPYRLPMTPPRWSCLVGWSGMPNELPASEKLMRTKINSELLGACRCSTALINRA
jgi:uncharacterized membrane protein YgaE (UPF0421/DUF939 family)